MEIRNSINFKGFAHKVKKVAYNDNRMNDIKDGFTCVALPPQWNKLYSQTEYRSAFANLKRTFREIVPVIMKVQYAQGISGSQNYYENDVEELTFEEFKKYSQMDACQIMKNALNKVLKEEKFIDEQTQISVSMLNKGQTYYGQGYKINFKNPYKHKEYNLFFKIFLIDYVSNINHGKVPEITRSIYLNHNMARNKNFPKFYIGDINYESPYLISEYIEDDAKNSSMQYPHSLLGLQFSDHYQNHNMISDYYIDAGGIKIINMLAYNPVARAIAKKIYRTPDNKKYTLWANIFERLAPQKSDMIIGLCYGVKYLPENCRQKCIEKIKNSSYYKSEKIKQALSESAK